MALPPRAAAAEAFIARWQFVLVCRGCKAQFEVVEPTVGLDVLVGFARMLMLRAPEVCPDCKSLVVVRDRCEETALGIRCVLSRGHDGPHRGNGGDPDEEVIDDEEPTSA